MSTPIHEDLIGRLVSSLLGSEEKEFIEVKRNNTDPEAIGEYLSALSNSATLHNAPNGYLVWGIDDTHKQLVGTKFDPTATKVGNQALELWLSTLLTPRLDFRFYTKEIAGQRVVVLEIPAARQSPTRFKNEAFIRVGSHKAKLKDYVEKERTLWELFGRSSFEQDIALSGLPAEKALSLLEYHAYFQLTGHPLPNDRSAIMDRFVSEGFLLEQHGLYSITNLGAILFARDLNPFPRLSRKALRIIVYKGTNKLQTVRERLETKGYAVGFADAVRFIKEQIPSNEHIGEVFRQEVPMYPEKAIRELLANCLIHQDFAISGAGATVEVYQDRMEITNPGQPLIAIERLIDMPPRSRNETLAAFMRRINLAEERGSGIDKVIAQIEMFQLPPPDFRVSGDNFVAVLFAPRKFAAMTPRERVRACYQHACLLYISSKVMSNSSLRERLGIHEKNYSMVSRLIAEAKKQGVIKPGATQNTYLPFWA